MVNFNEYIEEDDFEITIDYLNCTKIWEIDRKLKTYKTILAKDKYDVGMVKYYEAHIDVQVHILQ